MIYTPQQYAAIMRKRVEIRRRAEDIQEKKNAS
jgi:hypothetical protein